MIKPLFGCLLIVLNFQLYATQQSWVGFYNLENLFDTVSSVGVEDEDRTPHGKYRWTSDRMELKIKKLHSVIDSINQTVDPYEWSVLGVCEVENAALINQLCKRFDPSQNCRFVHFESPDLRGIDVALLYNAKRFRPTHFERKKVKLFLSDDTPKYTRDLLVVSGWLTQLKVHFIVAHWPSRSGGQKRSEHFRSTASYYSRRIIDSIRAKDPKAQIVLMGDLNDDPTDRSVKRLVKETVKFEGLYNPMEALHQKGVGSIAHQDRWHLFDQLIFTPNFKTEGALQLTGAGVFKRPFLTQKNGRYKNYPLRTYVGTQYSGGYSDHFPVIALLKTTVPKEYD